MYIERIEKIYLSKREDEALDVVFCLIEQLENDSMNEKVKNIAGHLRNHLEDLLGYTEEALCGVE